MVDVNVPVDNAVAIAMTGTFLVVLGAPPAPDATDRFRWTAREGDTVHAQPNGKQASTANRTDTTFMIGFQVI